MFGVENVEDLLDQLQSWVRITEGKETMVAVVDKVPKVFFHFFIRRHHLDLLVDQSLSWFSAKSVNLFSCRVM